MKIIVAIPFTGKTPYGDGFRGQPWYKFRYKVFREYTLKSLMNQTDKDFLIWVQLRPQEETNPITKKIEDELKKSGLDYVMTFNGPIIMEDRALEHNVDLIERAGKSLKKLGEIKDNYVVEISLDSDDMIHKKFVELLRTKEITDRKAFYMKKGFMYSVNNRLADWNNPFSMSIYAITYLTDIFLDAKKHFDYQNGFNSHEQIPDKFDAELLPDGLFCCIYHTMNISTTWEHQYMGKEYYYADEIENTLKDFKIN